mmetsp:Transcript_14089/g.39434  ORF Transcript_14089/g.39434 Transcript_14089/m.39434 type:complete len:201 (+) Transcript_14089:1121-1723(+)
MDRLRPDRRGGRQDAQGPQDHSGRMRDLSKIRGCLVGSRTPAPPAGGKEHPGNGCPPGRQQCSPLSESDRARDTARAQKGRAAKGPRGKPPFAPVVETGHRSGGFAGPGKALALCGRRKGPDRNRAVVGTGTPRDLRRGAKDPQQGPQGSPPRKSHLDGRLQTRGIAKSLFASPEARRKGVQDLGPKGGCHFAEPMDIGG